MKRHIPLVRYVVLVGQDAPYLCALLTLKVSQLVLSLVASLGCWLDGGGHPGFKMGRLGRLEGGSVGEASDSWFPFRFVSSSSASGSVLTVRSLLGILSLSLSLSLSLPLPSP